MRETELNHSGSDPSSPHRLPYTVSPRRYRLRLAPDLEAATFCGEVTIDVEVHETVEQIVLHAAELEIGEVSVIPAQGGAWGPPGDDIGASIVLDEDQERLSLLLDHALRAGRAEIRISFTGTLNDRLHGFYRSEFLDEDGVTRFIATTQFEATDARRAFPCFDEPDRKAVFSVVIDVPEGLSAFSNGPETKREPLLNGGTRVTFGDTIPMSTYLVAFVVGPLEATDPLDVDGTEVRIVHVPGKAGLTSFALDCAAHALRFFSEWFDIPYPSEKLDLLAIPDFAFGAMENLGCVTFRETALLVDPERASRLEMERVADVISHEIAHMWFGDLVTMKWWNGIWLNEAFATFMELLCVDHYRPQWQRWVTFGMERELAMATDSLHSTRPVEYPVGPPEEAQGMFDVLTYQKGASVLRMLERYLGPETFRDGIRRYLDAHRYANTDTSDLWDAIEAASGEPVRRIMDSWIFQGGFPLVELASGDPDAHTAPQLRQRPFSYQPAPPGTTSAIGESWQVPVLWRTLGDNPFSGKTLCQDAAGSKEPAQQITGDGGTVVLNAGGSGYYRVRYESDHLSALASSLAELDALERFNLVGDTWAAVVAGLSSLDDMLKMAEALRTSNERDPDVWGQAIRALELLDHVLDDSSRPALARYTRALVGPVLGQLGWDRRDGDSERTSTLRAQLISVLGHVGHDSGVAEQCAARHALMVAGDEDLDPDIASAVVGVVAAWGAEPEFETFLERYRKPQTPQEEMRYLLALSGFRHDDLAARAFELAMSEVRTQNAPFVIQLLLTNRHVSQATWKRLRDSWDDVVSRTPPNLLPRMLEGVKLLCADPGLAQEVKDFLDAHPVAVGRRTVEQAVERLGVNVAFGARIRPSAGASLYMGIERLKEI